jgi:hypothetical protein
VYAPQEASTTVSISVVVLDDLALSISYVDVVELV